MILCCKTEMLWAIEDKRITCITVQLIPYFIFLLIYININYKLINYLDIPFVLSFLLIIFFYK